MKKFVFCLLGFGLANPMMAQIIRTEQLSEVTVYATNYKYLNSVASFEPAAVPVQLLERKVAAFDLMDSDFYNDEYDLYHISFYIPEGKILAAYDANGKILRTVERFENVALPVSVRDAVAARFPGWVVSKDVYAVSFHQEKGVSKTYKLVLVNGDQKLRVKLDDTGAFL
jgi:hypothetical protein